jgi:hypothetical protein
MSLLLDALRRLDSNVPAKTAETSHGVPDGGRAPKVRPIGSSTAIPPRAVRIPASAFPLENSAAAAAEAAVAKATIAEMREPSSTASPTTAAEIATVIEQPATSPVPARDTASEPPTWETAYYPEKPSPASARYVARAEATEPKPQPVVESPATPAAVESPAQPPAAAQGRPVVEIPRRTSSFDCRGLAAAVRRLRPAGGRLALVSVGHASSTSGVPDWSADLADELACVAALPVERFASGRLAVDGESGDAPASGGYRLYFLGAEFSAARGALLRKLDGVLLVVEEGATTVKAAEVVRGTLEAQGVAFAGFVYVAR